MSTFETTPPRAATRLPTWPPNRSTRSRAARPVPDQDLATPTGPVHAPPIQPAPLQNPQPPRHAAALPKPVPVPPAAAPPRQHGAGDPHPPPHQTPVTVTVQFTVYGEDAFATAAAVADRLRPIIRAAEPIRLDRSVPEVLPTVATAPTVTMAATAPAVPAAVPPGQPATDPYDHAGTVRELDRRDPGHPPAYDSTGYDGPEYDPADPGIGGTGVAGHPRHGLTGRGRPRDTPLRILSAGYRAELDGVPLALTRREYDLLLFLAEHPGQVFTRVQLLQTVWQQAFVSGQRTIDVHVRRLRAKLGERGPVIATVRGVGYRLDGPDRVCVIREALQ